MERQYKIWDSLKYEDRESLAEYYKLVLITGVCKQRTPDLLKKHKKLLRWCAKKKLTIWDIPKDIFQSLQEITVGKTMETPL